MGVDVKIRGVKIWRDNKQGFPKYSISVSKNVGNNEYVRQYISLKFTKDIGTPDIENGDTVNLDGFLALDTWKDKNSGENRKSLVIVCNKMDYPVTQNNDTFIGDLGDTFQMAEDDIPF